jgi:hypothetical protein
MGFTWVRSNCGRCACATRWDYANTSADTDTNANINARTKLFDNAA